MNDASTHHGNRHAVRPGGLALAAGLLLAPAAWIAQTNLAQLISAWGCFPHERPVSRPAMPWLEHGLLILALIALLTGLAGGVVAWRNWKRTGVLAREVKVQSTIDRHVGRDMFIARAGALGSALFVFALISTDLAWWLVSPCGGR
jgi:hypothetical protein